MRIPLVLIAVLLTALSAAQLKKSDVVGKWNAKMKLDASKAPKTVKPEQIQMAQKQLDAVKMLCDFKNDGTFVVDVSAGGRSEKIAGTWKIEGSKLVTIDKTKNGKPVPKPKEDKATVIKKGAELWVMQGGPNDARYIVLTRTK